MALCRLRKERDWFGSDGDFGLVVKYLDSVLCDLEKLLESPARCADIVVARLYLVEVGLNLLLQYPFFPIDLP